MDAKKVGLYVIFGMAIAYLISAIGWSGSRISTCNEEFEKAIADIDFKIMTAKHSNGFPALKSMVSPSFYTKTYDDCNNAYTASGATAEDKKKAVDSACELMESQAKEVPEAKKKLCLSNSKNDVYLMNIWAHFYDNKHFSSSDIASDVGVSSIGYLVMYCLLFVAVGLGIFATIKDHKIMMITFSATVGVSALILFIFNIVFMARSIAPRNNYSKAIEDLSQKERLGFGSLKNHMDTILDFTINQGWNEYEKFVKPDQDTLTRTNKNVTNFQTTKATAIKTAETNQKTAEADWATQQTAIVNATDPEDKKQRQAALDFSKKQFKHTYSEKYEADKKAWDAETKIQGFMEFTLAFAEFSFFVISSVVGFMLFKC